MVVAEEGHPGRRRWAWRRRRAPAARSFGRMKLPPSSKAGGAWMAVVISGWKTLERSPLTYSATNSGSVPAGEDAQEDAGSQTSVPPDDRQVVVPGLVGLLGGGLAARLQSTVGVAPRSGHSP